MFGIENDTGCLMFGIENDTKTRSFGIKGVFHNKL